MESGKEGEEGGENIRLKRIMEEDEEEEESSAIDEEEDEEEDELVDEEEEGDEDDGRIGGRQRHKQMRNSNEEDEVEMHEFGDEEEQIRVRTNKPEKMLPEDEDFMRDFDRMMAESLQVGIQFGFEPRPPGSPRILVFGPPFPWSSLEFRQ